MSKIIVLTFKMIDGSTYHFKHTDSTGDVQAILVGERSSYTVWKMNDILSGNKVSIPFRHVIAAYHECDVEVISEIYRVLKKRKTSIKNKLSIEDGEPMAVNFNNTEYLTTVDNDIIALQNYFNNECTLCYDEE